MKIKKEFENWAINLSGCDGGNLDGKIWLSGIEWGGGQNPKLLNFEKETKELANATPVRSSSETERILANKDRKNTYDLNAYKLLSVIAKNDHLDNFKFKEFILNERPFEKKSNYFKLNIYPISFRNTSDSLWNDEWKNKTGFENKYLYKLWCWKFRFSFLQNLVINHSPKLIICVGKTYITDFIFAFEGIDKLRAHNEINFHKVNNNDLACLKVNNGKTLLCITPFLTNAGNLVGNEIISAFGKKIRNLI
ncbi:hypothetical protein [Leptospira perdikensis]|uniref:Uracil-DNA glycosylase-like domain-containing protein n=1 Tax=Leptospira perdikensis TaxID=2484948 RepID=A0A4R9JKF0_9LEPT|nr:hypothetical protein [Leptospira perdikensis]TGL45969.1 hypothetical protein EHQ49_00865 [Leptospira perdikensis]